MMEKDLVIEISKRNGMTAEARGLIQTVKRLERYDRR